MRDPRGTAARYAGALGVAFDESWQASVGGHEIRLRADAAPPTVELTAEPGTRGLDVVQHGVRWVRRGQPAA